MGALQEGMDLLISFGLVDVILPFLLIFGISFALLQRIKLFGKEGNYRNYNALIAFCLGFFVVYNYNIVSNLPEFIARIGILFVVIVSLLIVTGILGLNKEYNSKLMSFVIMVYLAYTIVDVYFPNFKVLLSESAIVTIVTVLVFGLIVWFVLRPAKVSKEKSIENKPKTEIPEREESIPTREAPKQDQMETRQESPEQRRRSPPRQGTDMNIGEPETIWER